MGTKSSRVILSLASILFILSSLVACESKSPSSESGPEDLIRPAKLVEVSKSDSDVFLNYPAVIRSQQLSILSFEVGGILKALSVVEAQRVNKGDVLATLDQRDLQANLKSAKAQFDNAEAEYQRAVRLIKGDAISRSTLEQRKSQRDVSKAQLETAEKALQDTVLLAPYAGNIAKISVKEQQAVQPGEAAISILGSGGLEASINIPSSIIALAREDKEPRSNTYLTLDVAPERRIPAVYKEVSLEADAASQTYEVTFTFEAPDGLNILPGMNGTIWFKDPTKANIPSKLVNIPLTAIMTDGDKKYVWVVNKESMAVTKREVTVVDGVGANLSISSGLEPGETIVAAGVSVLSEGMKVRPWSK